MKKQLKVGAVVLVLLSAAWLLRHEARRNIQPAAATTASAPARPSLGERSEMKSPADATRAVLPPAVRGAAAAVAPTAPVDAAQVAEVRHALAELKKLYGPAGALEWEAAKALIAQREQATQELVDRLAQLGPGGARAIASGYAEADSTRAKLLLVHALGKLNDAEAAGVLQTLLDGADSLSVRKEMVLALRQRPEAAAEEALAGVLANEDDAQLRFASAQGLSGRASALPVLAERIRRDTSPEVRKELIRSIGLVGTAAAADALAEVAQSRTDVAVRQTAIQELGRSFGASALGVLERLLADPDETMRHTAVKAVARVNTDRALALLQRSATTDSSPVVRESAAAALSAHQSRADASAPGQRR